MGPHLVGLCCKKERELDTFEDKVGAAHHKVGVETSAVASAGVDGKGWVFADRVRVVVVVALPGVVVVVEDKVSGEEEHLGADLAALAHPLAVQAHRQVGPRRQDRGVELVRAVDDATGDAAVVVILQEKHWGVSGGSLDKLRSTAVLR